MGGGAGRAVTRAYPAGRAARRAAANVTPVSFVETVVRTAWKTVTFPGDGPGDHRGDCCKTSDFGGDRRFYLKNYKQLLNLYIKTTVSTEVTGFTTVSTTVSRTVFG